MTKTKLNNNEIDEFTKIANLSPLWMAKGDELLVTAECQGNRPPLVNTPVACSLRSGRFLTLLFQIDV